jgi:hypothetical protein
MTLSEANSSPRSSLTSMDDEDDLAPPTPLLHMQPARLSFMASSPAPQVDTPTAHTPPEPQQEQPSDGATRTLDPVLPLLTAIPALLPATPGPTAPTTSSDTPPHQQEIQLGPNTIKHLGIDPASIAITAMATDHTHPQEAPEDNTPALPAPQQEEVFGGQLTQHPGLDPALVTAIPTPVTTTTAAHTMEDPPPAPPATHPPEWHWNLDPQQLTASGVTALGLDPNAVSVTALPAPDLPAVETPKANSPAASVDLSPPKVQSLGLDPTRVAVLVQRTREWAAPTKPYGKRRPPPPPPRVQTAPNPTDDTTPPSTTELSEPSAPVATVSSAQSPAQLPAPPRPLSRHQLTFETFGKGIRPAQTPCNDHLSAQSGTLGPLPDEDWTMGNMARSIAPKRDTTEGSAPETPPKRHRKPRKPGAMITTDLVVPYNCDTTDSGPSTSPHLPAEDRKPTYAEMLRRPAPRAPPLRPQPPLQRTGTRRTESLFKRGAL